MLLRLRSIVFAAITTCIVAGGYAAQTPLHDDSGKAEGGLANDISASLVVCGRGPRLISSFGHCSIHMSCPSAGLDSYYTYLIWASPENIRRFFAEGLCTGHFEAQKWDDFKKDYVEQNRPITEYKLNLTTDEVRHLWLNLDRETYNSTSREYSFLHSQCTSICADVIRASLINERIEYGELPQGLTGTLRDFADHSVAGYPWYLFCFQSILGKEGEQKGTVWEKLAPADIYPVWSGASIVDAAGNRRPIFIDDGQTLLDGTYSPSKASPLTPTVCFAILLAIALLLTVFSKKQRKITANHGSLFLVEKHAHSVRIVPEVASRQDYLCGNGPTRRVKALADNGFRRIIVGIAFYGFFARGEKQYREYCRNHPGCCFLERLHVFAKLIFDL